MECVFLQGTVEGVTGKTKQIGLDIPSSLHSLQHNLLSMLFDQQ